MIIFCEKKIQTCQFLGAFELSIKQEKLKMLASIFYKIHNSYFHRGNPPNIPLIANIIFNYTKNFPLSHEPSYLHFLTVKLHFQLFVYSNKSSFQQFIIFWICSSWTWGFLSNYLNYDVCWWQVSNQIHSGAGAWQRYSFYNLKYLITALYVTII